MKQQTAVDYLLSRLSAMGLIEDIDDPLVQQIRNEARQMEKEQHGFTWDAAIKAHDDRGHVHARSIPDFDEYYNETYNTEQK